MSRAFAPALGRAAGDAASTTANCWSRRPFAWACPRRNWRRSTSSRPASSSGSAREASTSVTSRPWARLMRELAERGDVILVGRGGSRILRDDPRAFHVRLVAPMPVRVPPRDGVPLGAGGRRQEADRRERLPAAQLLRELLRRRLVESLGIRLTVNSGRLGPTAVEPGCDWPPSVTGAAPQ